MRYEFLTSRIFLVFATKKVPKKEERRREGTKLQDEKRRRSFFFAYTWKLRIHFFSHTRIHVMSSFLLSFGFVFVARLFSAVAVKASVVFSYLLLSLNINFWGIEELVGNTHHEFCIQLVIKWTHTMCVWDWKWHKATKTNSRQVKNL